MQQPQQPTGGGASSGPSAGGVLPEGSAAATAYAQHFAAQQALAEDLDRFWEQVRCVRAAPCNLRCPGAARTPRDPWVPASLERTAGPTSYPRCRRCHRLRRPKARWRSTARCWQTSRRRRCRWPASKRCGAACRRHTDAACWCSRQPVGALCNQQPGSSPHKLAACTRLQCDTPFQQSQCHLAPTATYAAHPPLPFRS